MKRSPNSHHEILTGGFTLLSLAAAAGKGKRKGKGKGKEKVGVTSAKLCLEEARLVRLCTAGSQLSGLEGGVGWQGKGKNHK